jgi:hypothetical protein
MSLTLRLHQKQMVALRTPATEVLSLQTKLHRRPQVCGARSQR